MANVVVTNTNTPQIFAGNRVSVRTSGDRVYAFTTQDNATIRANKGNQNGEPTSFSIIATLGSIIGLQNVGCGVAIDSADLIHIIYKQDDPAMAGIHATRYVTFDPSTDTFGTPEDIATLDADGDPIDQNNIAIDVNDKPHVTWRDALTDMGTTKFFNYYSNRISGSWRARVEISNSTGTVDRVYDLMIADPASAINADRPIVLKGNSATINAFHGDALDATSFTDSGRINPLANAETGEDMSFMIDTNEKIVVIFIFTAAIFKMIRVEHINSDVWTTWVNELEITPDKFTDPSVAQNGTDVFVFAEDRDNNDIRLLKRTNGSYVEETADADLPNVGTFNNVKVKWSRYNNNSPTELDYVFEDSGGAVQYNTFSVAAGAALVKLVPETINPRENLADSILAILGIVKQVDETEDITATPETVDPPPRGLNRFANETEEISEDIVDPPPRAMTRFANETEEINEDLVAARNMARIIDEAEDITEQAEQVIGLNKIVDETINILEGVLSILGIVRQIDETEEISEQVNRLQAQTRVIDETENITENIVDPPPRGLTRLSNETEEISEGIIRLMDQTRVINETIDITEDIIKIIGLNKVVNETVEIAEGIISFLGKVRIVNETVDISEDENQVLGKVQIVNEILEINEGVISHLDMVRIINETEEIAEGIVRLMNQVRIVNETVEAREFDTTIIHERGDSSTNQIITPGSSNLEGVKVDAGAPAIGKKVRVIETRIRNRNGTQTGNIHMVVRDSSDIQKAISPNFLVNDMGVGTIRVDFELDVTITIAEADVIGIQNVDTAGANHIDVKGEDNAKASGFTVVGGTTQPYTPVGTDRRLAWTFGRFPGVIAHRARVAIADETVNITEQINKTILAGLIKVVDETVDITEQINKALGFSKIVDETIDIAEGIIGLLGQVRQIDETVDISEQTNKLIGIIKEANETVNITEGIVAARNLVRLINEVEQISEQVNKTIGLNKIINETVEISEQTVVVRALVRFANETVNILEQVNKALGVSKVVNETVNIVEEIVKALGFVRVVDETVDISENIVAVLGVVRQVDETLNILEQVNRRMAQTRVINETEEISEQILAVRGLVRILDETVDITEQTNKTLLAGLVRVVDETINIPENVVKALGLAKIVNETENTLENIVKILGLNKIVNEVIDITENIVRARGIVKQLNETIQIPEQVNAVRALVRIINETLQIPEQLTKVRSLIRIINEAVDIIEQALRRVSGLKVRIINETVNITEQTNAFVFFARFILKFITRIVKVIGGPGKSSFPTRIRQALKFFTRRKSDI